jgi:streptomycin 6-kinase
MAGRNAGGAQAQSRSGAVDQAGGDAASVRILGPGADRIGGGRGGGSDGAGGGPARHRVRRLPQTSLPKLWGELLAALHAVAPPAGWSWDLRGRCEEAFVRIGPRLAESAISAGIGQATWRRAIERCEALPDTQARLVLLHGDLHLGNVLDGGPSRGLVAIDPKACIGDPCFAAVDYVVAGAGHEGVEVRCQRVATACGLDGDRLYAWSRVTAPMFAIAYLTYEGPEPAIDELVALAR